MGINFYKFHRAKFDKRQGKFDREVASSRISLIGSCLLEANLTNVSLVEVCLMGLTLTEFSFRGASLRRISLRDKVDGDCFERAGFKRGVFGRDEVWYRKVGDRGMLDVGKSEIREVWVWGHLMPVPCFIFFEFLVASGHVWPVFLGFLWDDNRDTRGVWYRCGDDQKGAILVAMGPSSAVRLHVAIRCHKQVWNWWNWAEVAMYINLQPDEDWAESKYQALLTKHAPCENTTMAGGEALREPGRATPTPLQAQRTWPNLAKSKMKKWKKKKMRRRMMWTSRKHQRHGECELLMPLYWFGLKMWT